MKGILLYSSKYGTSERYAKMFSEQTGLPLADAVKADAAQLAAADCVIMFCGIYVGTLFQPQ